MFLLLVLLALCGFVFGAGFLCGYLVFRQPPSISVTLPSSSFADPLESLQKTLRRFDRQLAEYGHRMTRSVDEMKASGIGSSNLGGVANLLAANRDLERQISTFAADVQDVEHRLAAIDTGRASPPDDSQAENSSDPADTPPRDTTPNNRRTEMRHPFFCRQWVAPYSGVRAPEVEEFFPVQCRDISSGGISFFLDRTPTYEMVVIRLSGPTESRYLTARIKRTTPSGNLEYGRYVVGCQFLGTLHPSGLPPTLEESIQRKELRQEELALTAL